MAQKKAKKRDGRCAIFVRIPADTHAKLLRLVAKQVSNGNPSASMATVVTELLNGAPEP